MNKSLFVLFLFGPMFFSQLLAGVREVEVANVYQKKEVINGITFVHRVEDFNGIHKELWTMSGKEVDHAVYEESILDAEKEVRRREREHQELARAKEQKVKQQLTYDLYRTIVQRSVDDVVRLLAQFKKYPLDPYLVFSKDTMASAQHFELVDTQLVIQARETLAKSDEQLTLLELRELVHSLESLPERLNSMFFATVRNAIKKCDDTKLLKDLLEIVA